MTAVEDQHDDAPQPRPLARGASPATVRSRLLTEDQPRFVAAYEQALDEARRSLDLTPVHETVEYWRRMALLQSDQASFRRTVRAVAEIASGEPRPESEPFDETRGHAGV